MLFQYYVCHSLAASPHRGLQRIPALRAVALRIYSEYAAVSSNKLQVHVLQAIKASLPSGAEFVKSHKGTKYSKRDYYLMRVLMPIDDTQPHTVGEQLHQIVSHNSR